MLSSCNIEYFFYYGNELNATINICYIPCLPGVNPVFVVKEPCYHGNILVFVSRVSRQMERFPRDGGMEGEELLMEGILQLGSHPFQDVRGRGEGGGVDAYSLLC